MDDIRDYVKERYARAIKNSTSCCRSGACCCGTTGASDILNMTRGNYDGEILENTPEHMADQSFGCGNPFTEARIHPGETVLDLGSGAGLDLFLASEATGPYGKVIGLDMTDEMLETAAENLRGLDNVTLVKGYIEDMPLESGTVDVIISNCVINLSPDKGKVLKEAFRVLRPGGRFCVSDTVFLRPVTERAVKNLAAWSGCISGALQEAEYAALLKEAGFIDVEVRRTKVYEMPDALAAMTFPELSPEERNEINGALASAIILGKKPLVKPEEGRDFTVRRATSGDVPAIAALLEENGLTPLGVAETPENFLVLEYSGIAAVAGMEILGDTGLLRSLAVRRKDRKKGFGERMTDAVIDRAREKGVRTVYLLTETAERFFGRAGFTAARREDIPAPLMQSSALDRVCPQGSAVLRLFLG
ncbi:ubiquinone/menaquinone biosynthesis C-methylase UbiE [Aminivibrio pyruvatiphilus]|uniref:Arsenite methyltransferase n=1 Tax=Aminivibrio pyruvatiphilus TaxID=1005740 RepID=A0A4R8MM32_9BACT|nr:arsenite methyltransferase [Aminivibrio pyruvatiphilus]TDY65146.1 ubiquinone/menaquinone biosynthesis C-methylase UbiE [Aminivibrio pyruvatiphilus]